MAEPIVYVYSSNTEPKDMTSFKMFLKKIGKGAWNDFKITNKSTLGGSLKFGAGILAAPYFAKSSRTVTPLKWAWNALLKGDSVLPLEFTRSGALQVFELTTLQRLGAMGKVAAMKFLCVTVAYEFGVAVGAIGNQFLSQKTKDTIGGTIYQTINEEGWKDLWRHPFGYGMVWGSEGERLLNY